MFYLTSPVTTNTIIFNTGLQRGHHHRDDFAIEVQVGNNFEPVVITRVNSVGATFSGSRVKIGGQEEVRVSFETELSVYAVKIRAYGSDAGNENSVVNEIFVLFLSNANLNWSNNDVDEIWNQINYY